MSTSDPGINRGTNAIRVETRASRRVQSVEPYGGIAFMAEFPSASGRTFAPAGEIQGLMNRIPPLTAELTAGMSVIPWEEREGFRRFVIDARLTGAYVSEGRDYSPLFDALGSSMDPQLAQARSVYVDAAGTLTRDLYFYGITTTEAHARLGGRLALEVQAARYVRFAAGAGLYYATPYLLTFADGCNPNVSTGADDRRTTTPSGDAMCRDRSLVNGDSRQSIDLVGRRFRMDGEFQLDLFAQLIGQF